MIYKLVDELRSKENQSGICVSVIPLDLEPTNKVDAAKSFPPTERETERERQRVCV